MFGKFKHTGTAMDCGGDGQTGVTARLLVWIQIGSLIWFNLFNDSSYHISHIMLSVNATDQGWVLLLLTISLIPVLL